MNIRTSQSTLADYQTYIKTICEERGWDERTDIEKMLFLTEEVGEVAKEIRKHAGIYGYKTPETTDGLGEELVDVLNYILDIANVYNIDLTHAFQRKWETNSTRIWEN